MIARKYEKVVQDTAYKKYARLDSRPNTKKTSLMYQAPCSTILTVLHSPNWQLDHETITVWEKRIVIVCLVRN